MAAFQTGRRRSRRWSGRKELHQSGSTKVALRFAPVHTSYLPWYLPWAGPP